MQNKVGLNYETRQVHSFVIIVIMYLTFTIKELLAKRHRLYTERLLLVILTLIWVFVLKSTSILKDYLSEQLINDGKLWDLYLPVFLLQIMQSFDKYTFIRMIPYSLFVMCVLIPVRFVIYALCMAISVGNKWSIPWYIIFIGTLSFVQPDHVMVYYKEKHWMLKVLLSWEMFYMFPMYSALFEIVAYSKLGIISKWYHFLNYIIRKVLCACFLGGIVGLLSGYVAKRIIDDPICYLLLLFGTLYCTFFFTHLVALLPNFAYIVVVLMLLQHKEDLTDEGNALVKTTVSFIYYILTIFIFTMAVYDFDLKLIASASGTMEINEAILAYCGLLVSRLVSYCVAYPLLRWYWPGFGFLRVVMVSCSGVSGVYTMLVAMQIYSMTQEAIGLHLMTTVALINILTHIINGLGLSLLLSPWNTAKRVNQSNVKTCIAFINDQKERFVGLWKCKHIMADTRWDILYNYTLMKMSLFSNVTADRHRRGVCSNCKKVVYATVNDKDKVDMKMEVRRLLLTELKSLVYRKQSLGCMSRVTVRTVQKIVKLMYEDNDLSLRYTEIEIFFKRNTTMDKMLKLYHRIFILKVDRIIKPRRPFRKLCYKIIFSRTYIYFMMIVNGLCVVGLIAHYLSEEGTPEYIVSVLIHFISSIMMIFDFVITLQAYSFVYFKDGIKAYFSIGWHRFDFCIVLLLITDYILHLFSFLIIQNHRILEMIIKYLNCLRILRVFVFNSHSSPPLLHLFEEIRNARYSLGLETMKIIISCLDDLLLYMHQVVSVGYDLEMEIREKIEKERTWLMSMMVKIYKEQPTLARHLSTKMALTAITHSIQTMLKEFKVFGYIDGFEYARMERKIEQMESWAAKMSRKIKEQNDELFYGVTWLPNNKKAVQHLYDNSIIIDFKENWMLIGPDRHLYGVYIIISGMLKVEYEPTIASVDPLYTNGQIPIVGYLESVKFDRQFEQVITAGNTIGELCFLTGRPYSGKVSTITKVKAFFINRHTIIDAIEMDTNTCESIPQKMWKDACMYIAVAIIFHLPVFQIMTRLQVKSKLNRGYIPILQDCTVFCTNRLIEDLYLIDGKMASFYDRRTFTAPCYIPRTVSKLFVPLTDIELPACVLLVIPIMGVNLEELIEEIEKINSMEAENHLKASSQKFYTRPPPMKRKELLEMSSSSYLNFDWIKIMRNN